MGQYPGNYSGKFATEVEDFNLYTLNLYPNPAQNSISLRDFTANDARILLFNLKGQIVPCQFIPRVRNLLRIFLHSLPVIILLKQSAENRCIPVVS
ncbi:MAG: hypothetical protein HWD58_14740 [Bacteroidota bacterium]|nr:MAG: hypothetical protein HWD58_14740 [Bacteroidota bacterium]